jgi:hypothetical protein
VLIKTQPSGYSTRVARLTLQNDAERALTNDQLMRLVDNHQGITFDRETDSYSLNGDDFGPDRRFGGSVKPHAGEPDVRLVTVYID